MTTNHPQTSSQDARRRGRDVFLRFSSVPRKRESRSPEGQWVISRRDDLLWFQGSALVGLALLVCFSQTPALTNATYNATHPAVLLLLLWGIVFDGTHVWATYTRSYLAPDQPSRSALPGVWSWGVVFVGPLLALLDYWLCAPSPSQLAQAGLLFRAFLVVAYLWAYWHLVRQHYGFLMLYRRSAGETSRAGARLDAFVLWAGCLYPYLRFSLSNAYSQSGLLPTVPSALHASARFGLDVAVVLTLTVLLGLIVTERWERLQLGPKHLFLTIVIAFHLLVFSILENLLTLTATLTIFHNLQYHRIVWQYEHGLGRIPMGNLATYLFVGVLFGVAWYGPRFGGVAVAQSDLTRNILLGLGWGFAFHHYVVDGMIWHVRRSPAVVAALAARQVHA
ncbi:MAG: hypothetical protein FJ147_04350 [Deltaproteobacteria bacterium]|nr:hypothetical protein [Deltaproteobacteria bacterium]